MGTPGPSFWIRMSHEHGGSLVPCACPTNYFRCSGMSWNSAVIDILVISWRSPVQVCAGDMLMTVMSLASAQSIAPCALDARQCALLTGMAGVCLLEVADQQPQHCSTSHGWL